MLSHIIGDFEIIDEILDTSDSIIYKTPIGSVAANMLPFHFYKKYKRIYVVYPKDKFSETQYRYVKESSRNQPIQRNIYHGQDIRSKDIREKQGQSYIYYVTAEELKNKMYQNHTANRNLTEFADLIIIQQADYTGLDYSLIILLINYSRNKGRYPKVIFVTSVTLSRDEINTMETVPEEYPSSEDLTPQSKIEIKYMEPPKRYGKEYYSMLVETIQDAVKTTLIGRCVLVFLPDRREILKVKARLEAVNMANIVTFLINDMQKYLNPKTVLIILTNDVSDSLLHTNEIDVVIDTMFQNESKISESNSRLTIKQTITQTLAAKRTARLGVDNSVNTRTCIRLVSESELLRRRSLLYYVDGNRKYEIQYFPLFDVLLEMTIHKIPFEEVLVTIDPEIYNEYQRKLLDYKMLEKQANEKISITTFGIFSKNLALTPSNVKILQYFYENEQYHDFIFGAIAFISIIECWGPIFVETPDDINQQFKLREIKKNYNYRTDMEAYLSILSNYFQLSKELNISLSAKVNRYIYDQLINMNRFTNIVYKMRYIIKRLHERNFIVKNSRKTLYESIDVMREIVPKFYKEYEYNVDDNKIMLAGRDTRVNISLNNYQIDRPTKIIPFGNMVIKKDDGGLETIVGLSFY